MEVLSKELLHLKERQRVSSAVRFDKPLAIAEKPLIMAQEIVADVKKSLEEVARSMEKEGKKMEGPVAEMRKAAEKIGKLQTVLQSAGNKTDQLSKTVDYGMADNYYDSKFEELRSALEISRNRLKELEATHEAELNRCLRQHKEQLIEYGTIVQNQSMELKTSSDFIESMKEELIVLKVNGTYLN